MGGTRGSGGLSLHFYVPRCGGIRTWIMALSGKRTGGRRRTWAESQWRCCGVFPMMFAEWGLPHTLQAYPSRSKACRFSLLQDAQWPQGEDLFKPARTANCGPIPLPSKPYSFVFSLESFSRMNASISGALARIRSHCSL